jgi:transposase
MEQLVECVAGLDVHRDSIVVTVRRRIGKRDQRETRTFETYPDALRELARWLKEAGVQVAGMESTGVYFRPVHRELQRAGITSWVVNAAHVKQVPGRKTDVSDSEWLSKLVMYGLVRPSFIPDEHLESLRMLTRLRAQTVGEQTRSKNRIIKLLESLGIKLAGICTDVLGKSGRAILQALIDGKLSPEQMAGLAEGKLRKKRPLLLRALQVGLNDEAKWLLRELLATHQQLEQRIERLDGRIHNALQPYRKDVELLEHIEGLSTVSIGAVLAETGADMSIFSSAKHLASWAGLSPGKNESAGKSKSAPVRRGNPWLCTILVQISWVISRTRKSPWRGTFARLARTTGSAKKAAVAIARRLLVTIYHVLSDREYRPSSPKPLSDVERRRRAQQALSTLAQLGFTVTLPEAATCPG